MTLKGKNFIWLTLLAIALIFIGYRVSVTKYSPDMTIQHAPLYVQANQLARAFVETNNRRKVFQSPAHPVVGGQFIFHDVSQLVVANVGLDGPLTFAGRPPGGSAVVTLNTYDADRSKDDPERVKKVSFRPRLSVNSAVQTQELIRDFYDVMRLRSGCHPVDAKGKEIGLSLLEENAKDLSIEVLESAIAQPEVDFHMVESFRCDETNISLEVSQPFRLKDVRIEDRGFDVLIFVTSRQL